MQKQLFTILLVAASFMGIAQRPTEVSAPAPKSTEKDPNGDFKRELNLSQKTENKGEVTIKGQKVPYKVTATTQPVWDGDG